MANRKLRVVYLWADERIMLEDFEKEVSSKMTDWANKFFRTHEFDLSVEPPGTDRKSVARASKYLLRKTDGVRPDWRQVSKITEEEDAKAIVIEQQLEENKKKLLVASRRVDAATRSLRFLESEASRLFKAFINSTSATFDANRAAHEAANARVAPAEGILANEKAKEDRLDEERSRLLDESIANSRRIVANLANSTAHILVLREQMAEIYRNHKIGSRKTLNVVFCRAAGRLSMRRSKYRTVGATHGLESSAIVALETMKPVWPFPFILVDLGADRSTLAHEMVHAAGHGAHPPDRMIRVLEKRISGLTFPRTVGPGAKASLFRDIQYSYEDVERYERVPGGYFAETKNDIMTYTDDDPEPDKVTLSKEDQELMKNAFFGEP